jgi:hypothetical protein
MLKSEYDAFTTKYNELLSFKAQKDDLVLLKNHLESKTITALEVSWSGGRNGTTYALDGIKTDLTASITDEIATLTTSIATKKGELLALTATTTGPDTAFAEIV